ncbi:hypothetical protein K2173_025182 [Erythroxylum novogranatense]|uniref:Glycine-rich protein n=1 Tax=Erythroxylum novogranatense TaxID=1862640 RepID=A0AAV8SVP8_9ROSI|nr:hypothetical protein K2173_025182 [Erythroxylum novogranatense]
MGSKKLGLFLVFMNCLYPFASSSSLQRSLLSGTWKELNVNDIDCGNECNGDMKLARGGGGQASRGGGSTEKGNDNQNMPGGAAAIPVIIAGAANNNRHHNRHNGATGSSKNFKYFLTMVLITLTSLIVHPHPNIY